MEISADRRTGRRARADFAVQVVALSLLLQVLPLRSARAEDRLDSKIMYYQEENDRMRIIAPTFLYHKDIGANLTMKVEGIYNSISGASPTGAPPIRAPRAAAAPVVISGGGGGGGGGDDGEGEDGEGEDDAAPGRAFSRARSFLRYSGASPAPTPAPSPRPSSPSASSQAATPAATAKETVPVAQVEDQRYGLSLEIGGRVSRHTPAVQFSGSTEDDYTSLGIAVRDGIDFNQKNTTLLLGGAYTHDTIDAVTMPQSKNKDTVDLMAGITQLLGPKAFAQVNFVHSRATGYMSDPYKVVELNGALAPEKRPEDKNKNVVYLALNRYFEWLRGSSEVSYRWYDDSFGVTAHTASLAWYQKMGRFFILRPEVRYYTQSEADFFAVRFAGNPEFYSADYRVSPMDALGYGLKLVWTPNEKFSADIAFDRYAQQGRNSGLPDDAYPVANIVTAGIRLWF